MQGDVSNFPSINSSTNMSYDRNLNFYNVKVHPICYSLFWSQSRWLSQSFSSDQGTLLCLICARPFSCFIYLFLSLLKILMPCFHYSLSIVKTFSVFLVYLLFVCVLKYYYVLCIFIFHSCKWYWLYIFPSFLFFTKDYIFKICPYFYRCF